MKFENIFPIPVGVSNFTESYDKDFLLLQPQKNNLCNSSSVDNYILRHPEIANLTAFIAGSLQEYFRAIFQPTEDVRLKITQSWLNWTKPGQHHHKHNHANSLISGCFYVSADRETDKIYFYQDAYKRIKIPTVESNEYNSNSWRCSVGSGDLVLFPSELEHMVQPVIGEGVRVSLAFNAFPVGLLGSENEMTILELS